MPFLWSITMWTTQTKAQVIMYILKVFSCPHPEGCGLSERPLSDPRRFHNYVQVELRIFYYFRHTLHVQFWGHWRVNWPCQQLCWEGPLHAPPPSSAHFPPCVHLLAHTADRCLACPRPQGTPHTRKRSGEGGVRCVPKMFIVHVLWVGIFIIIEWHFTF